MLNPIDVIGLSRRRLVRLAILRTALYASIPLIATLAAALGVDVIGMIVAERWGYVLEAVRAAGLRDAIVGLAGAEIAMTALLAWLAARKADDFIGTAERIDGLAGCHQEILTLATLSDPAKPQARELRTPLFPMLWRRAIAYLEGFEPKREFRLEFGEPLKRSSLFAIGAVMLLGLATFALIRPPTPAEALARRLRELARALDTPSSAPGRQIAEAARYVAKDLENPELPPERKVAELQTLKQALEKYQAQNQSGSGNGSSGGGGGSGKGNGSGSGEGQGPGKGAGGGGQGQGGGGKSGKTQSQMLELRNDISKAQAQMQMEAGKGEQSKVAQRQNGEKGTGLAPKEGNNPNQAGPQPKPGGAGNIELPQPGSLAQNQARSGNKQSNRKDDKGSQGDTHLGDFPKAANYERFYKLGEKGPPVDIRDARYVVFRLPTAATSAGSEGRIVADSGRPIASTAYTNAPLKEQRLPVSPDEQQLVPPRYRDLIH